MKNFNVCIVGAGSMGILTGYHLSLAGAKVTFLVRPHRQEALSNPQVLYSFDDNTLKTYSGYDVLTDPRELADRSFDFVVVTLDGTALRADAGMRLVTELGRTFRGTDTGVILGSVGIDHRSWFIETAGLSETQVTNGVLMMFAYEAQSLEMPVHDGVRADLLGRANYGYAHGSEYGFAVDLGATKVARSFAGLYDRSGASKCSLMSLADFKAQVGFFPSIAAWELLGWPSVADISPTDETWVLGKEATREVLQLRVFGQAGRAPGSEPGDILSFFRRMEAATRPFDFAAFNRYHHGGKVNEQDHDLLRELLRLGEAEGADMQALRDLVARLPGPRSAR